MACEKKFFPNRFSMDINTKKTTLSFYDKYNSDDKTGMENDLWSMKQRENNEHQRREKLLKHCVSVFQYSALFFFFLSLFIDNSFVHMTPSIRHGWLIALQNIAFFSPVLFEYIIEDDFHTNCPGKKKRRKKCIEPVSSFDSQLRKFLFSKRNIASSTRFYYVWITVLQIKVYQYLIE